MDPAADPGDGERVTAQVEQILVQTDLVDLEYVLPDRADLRDHLVVTDAGRRLRWIGLRGGGAVTRRLG